MKIDKLETDSSKSDTVNISKSYDRINESSQAGKAQTPFFVYTLSLMAAIGGFLFGYDTGVISGAMLLIKDEFSLSTSWQELIVSVTVGAAALLALLGGFLSDTFGRKPVIFISSVVFTIGAFVLAGSQSRIMLVIGRFIVGAGIGLASMSSPMYIAEASPPELRGQLVTVNNLFITGGQFCAGIIDGVFNAVPDGWRYMLGLAAIPSIVQFIGFFFLPESPRWLANKGRFDLAEKVLCRIRASLHDAKVELEEIKTSIEDVEREKSQHSNGSDFVVKQMLTMPHLRRALIIGCALQMFQQVCGINTVMYYSATIIRLAGIKSKGLAIWLAAVTAGINFFCTFIGLYLVEKIGRRVLTLLSLLGVMLSLLLLGVGFQLMAAHSPSIALHTPNTGVCSSYNFCDGCINDNNCGYCFVDNLKLTNYNGTCLQVSSSDDSSMSKQAPCNRKLSDSEHLTWAYQWCPTPYSWLPILGLALYLFFFAPGMGPMPWTINSEIYPQWARSTGIALATATNWIFNLIVSFTFLSLMEAITKPGAYYLYTGIALIGLIFFFLFLPETKGRTLEEMEGVFARPWFGRGTAPAGVRFQSSPSVVREESKSGEEIFTF